MRFSLFLAAYLLFAPNAALAEDSPKYAQRGVAAYRAGQFDLARMYFSKALQDARLSGKEEWIAMSTFNLADLELERGNEEETGRLLQGIRPADDRVLCLWLWKRSQLAFARNQVKPAVALVDSALSADVDKEFAPSLLGDRLRYLIRSAEPEAWKPELEKWRKRVGRPKSAAVEAAGAMASGLYDRADTLWHVAMDAYLEEGRLAMVAACLNQSALCLLSRGQRAEALEANSRASSVYGDLGLERPALKSRALRLLLLEDETQLANLRRDMDLVEKRSSGFDLQGILDGYSQSLHGGRGLDGVVGPFR